MLLTQNPDPSNQPNQPTQTIATTYWIIADPLIYFVLLIVENTFLFLSHELIQCTNQNEMNRTQTNEINKCVSFIITDELLKEETKTDVKCQWLDCEKRFMDLV